MLKFRDFSEKNINKVATELFDNDEYAAEILHSIDFSDEEVYYAAAYFAGCMLLRIFDYGHYMFLYPVELSGDADARAAILEIAEYARREEIRLIFTDVPKDAVSDFLYLGFLHLDVDSEGEDSYRVRIKTECELATSKIEFSHGDVALTDLDDTDCAEYADLCRDEVLNKYWGYDYKDDTPTASDEYFLIIEKEGRMLGTSMSLGVRVEGVLVGEVQFFAFDGRGECEVAVRIARGHQSQGIGSMALEAAIDFAKHIGIKRLSCDVMKENVKSLGMVRKYFDESESSLCDRIHFTKELNAQR